MVRAGYRMTTKPRHGGSRPVTRPDDKRLLTNQNAAKPAGTQRVRLSFSVSLATKAWIQRQADQTTGGNKSKWLNELAYYYGADAPEGE